MSSAGGIFQPYNLEKQYIMQVYPEANLYANHGAGLVPPKILTSLLANGYWIPNCVLAYKDAEGAFC